MYCQNVIDRMIPLKNAIIQGWNAKIFMSYGRGSIDNGLLRFLKSIVNTKSLYGILVLMQLLEILECLSNFKDAWSLMTLNKYGVGHN